MENSRKGVHIAFILAIKDIYDEVTTSVRAQGKATEDFHIIIGLTKGQL